MSKKAKKTKAPQFRRTCIFCGQENKLSEEHVFGDWIKNILPRIETYHVNTRIGVSKNAGTVYITPTIKQKQGHLGNKRLKIVCIKCNNEWLSNNFENPVKPCISEMILGKNSQISQEQQKTIALWAVKTVMVLEFDDPTRRGAPTEDLRHLRDSTEIPKGWKVWIGRYKGNTELRFRHRALGLFKRELANEILSSDNISINAQFTGLIIGNLMLHVLSGPTELVEPINLTHYSQYMELIWPVQTETIDWPSRLSSDRATFEKITNSNLAS